MTSLDRHDHEEIRCVHLGGPVTFDYCRRVNQGLPCKLIVGCWHRRIDIVAFLRDHFRAADLRKALDPAPGTSLERLVNLIERHESGAAGENAS